MAGIIPKEVIDEILSRSDLADLLQSYTVVKKTGGRLKALCPFHQEKTPSFMINQDQQVYYCFGCHKGGNIFNFVMEKENMDFPEAAHFLADRFGVTMRYEKGREIDRGGSKVGKDRLFKIHEAVSIWYHQNLLKNSGSRVAEYVRKRRIPAEVIKKFRLGAAPESYDSVIKYCKSESYTDEEIAASGLSVKNENSGVVYDRFRNRLVFPVWDEQNRVVGFSARTVEENFDGGKYVNSPETPLFKKNRLLYGLNFARKEIEDKKFIILCEGQFDVIAFHRAGYSMAAAPLGTAFSEEQAKIIKRYCDTVYLAMDSDEAGIKAVLRNIEILLPFDFRVLVIRFPSGEDPDSMLEKQGNDGINDVFSEATDFFDFAFEYFSSKSDIVTPWGKDAVAKSVLQCISKIDSPVARSHYSSELATRLKVPENAIFAELNNIKIGDRRREFYKDSESTKDSGKEQAESSPMLKAEETLLELALLHGTVAKSLAETLPSEMIGSSPVGKALEKVISMSLNGEWEYCADALRATLSEKPSALLGRILTEPSDIPEEKRETAAKECVVRIKEAFLKQAINDIIIKMKKTADEGEKEMLRKAFVAKNDELKKVFRELKSLKDY